MRVDIHPATNGLRGVLCHPCFSALGQTDYSVARLEAMIAYLRRGDGVDS